MGIIRNDNIELRVSKPIRDTDRVGVGYPYTTKELIPSTYRYLYMRTTDDGGVEWRLEGGLANSNWVKVTYGDLIPDISWVDLVAKTTRQAGQKYNIITDAPNAIRYGIVVLLTDLTFNYWDGQFERSVKIV